MDPIATLLNFLRSVAPSKEAFTLIENKVNDIFQSFALVPRQEYEAHLEVLETLRQQVAQLEARVDQIKD